MRLLTRGHAAFLAGGLSLACAIALGGTPPATATSAAHGRSAPIVYEDVVVGEVPNSVAVADNGTIAVSLFNEKVVAFALGAGVVTRVPLECSPSDVAIAPDASTAWAVCQDDPHVYVIEVVTGERLLADVGLRKAEDMVYLADSRRLVIADLAGEVVVVSATSEADYAVLERVATGAQRPSELAVLPDGTRGYAVTDAGALLAIDFAKGTSRVMTGRGATTSLSSLSLARSGTLLYAGAAIGSNATGFRSALVALDPVTGATVQEAPLDFAVPGSTTIKVAAGHRSLSVATGLALDLDGEATGLFDVALDDRGRMGTRNRIMPAGVYAIGSDVSRSADGTRIGAGTVNATVIGARTEDPAYPPTLSVQGKVKGTRLTLTGTTTGMQPGTVITVHVRDLTKPRQRFVTQAVTAVVDARGAYRWSGTVKPAKVQVFTSTQSPAASPTITVSRARP